MDVPAVSLILEELIDKADPLGMENIMEKQAGKQTGKQTESHEKNQDKSILVLQAARIIMGLAFIVLLGLLGYHLYEYWQGDQIYSDIRQTAFPEDMQDIAGSDDAAEPADEEGIIDFEALRRINPDCVAWICGCDGGIDYPVVLSQDDTYYLTHTITGESNKAGSIFVDQYAEAPFGEFQTILYGHNMKNGSMFHALLGYRDREYWEDHKTITVYLEGETKEYRIFAAYYSYYEELPVYDSMETMKEREAYIDRIEALSLYDTAVEVTAADQILTLITCEYSGEDYRMVVHAAEDLEQDE